MNLDDDDLEDMESKGRKVTGRKKPTPPEDSQEAKLLSKIVRLLEHQALHPPPAPKFPEIKPPVVTVNPTPVTIQSSKPATKWKFTLTKDKAGHTTEIIATAIE